MSDDVQRFFPRHVMILYRLQRSMYYQMQLEGENYVALKNLELNGHDLSEVIISSLG
jgi:hypothetical protein